MRCFMVLRKNWGSAVCDFVLLVGFIGKGILLRAILGLGLGMAEEFVMV